MRCKIEGAISSVCPPQHRTHESTRRTNRTDGSDGRIARSGRTDVLATDRNMRLPVVMHLRTTCLFSKGLHCVKVGDTVRKVVSQAV